MSDLYEIGLIAATSPEFGEALMRYLLGLAPTAEAGPDVRVGTDTRIAA
jgi:hypothetical protein